MLELRPNCGLCDCDLPPQSAEARICSYECTYCAECVATVLHDVCPTCGGGFMPRPIRPRAAVFGDKRLGLGHHPAGHTRHHLRMTVAEIAARVGPIKGIAPKDR